MYLVSIDIVLGYPNINFSNGIDIKQLLQKARVSDYAWDHREVCQAGGDQAIELGLRNYKHLTNQQLNRSFCVTVAIVSDLASTVDKSIPQRVCWKFKRKELENYPDG